MSETLVIPTPDDMHVHLREGDVLRSVVSYTSDVFARALVMPNTSRPVLSGEDVSAYRKEITDAAIESDRENGLKGVLFEPLMSVKLVRGTTADVIHGARFCNAVAAKFYPEGVTTNSEDGVADIRELSPALEAMQELDMVLCLHGEVPGVFCMDRETAFLDSLRWISTTFPGLRIVLEHVTTADAVNEVLSLPENVAATITAHHLFYTLDDVVGGMLNPHAFCKPIAKTESDRLALRTAAISGNPKFFFGSDTAPHLRGKKECASGCAGVFAAPTALEALAIAFEECGSLDRLAPFVSHFGADFYGLPRNSGTVTLTRRESVVDREISGVVPFLAGRTIPWLVTSDRHGPVV